MWTHCLRKDSCCPKPIIVASSTATSRGWLVKSKIDTLYSSIYIYTYRYLKKTSNPPYFYKIRHFDCRISSIPMLDHQSSQCLLINQKTSPQDISIKFIQRSKTHNIYGGFFKWRIPKSPWVLLKLSNFGWFGVLGYPHFRKPPYP